MNKTLSHVPLYLIASILNRIEIENPCPNTETIKIQKFPTTLHRPFSFSFYNRTLFIFLSLARTHARAQYPSLHETYNFFFYISVPSTIFFLSFFFLLSLSLSLSLLPFIPLPHTSLETPNTYFPLSSKPPRFPSAGNPSAHASFSCTHVTHIIHLGTVSLYTSARLERDPPPPRLTYEEYACWWMKEWSERKHCVYSNCIRHPPTVCLKTGGDWGLGTAENVLSCLSKKRLLEIMALKVDLSLDTWNILEKSL